MLVLIAFVLVLDTYSFLKMIFFETKKKRLTNNSYICAGIYKDVNHCDEILTGLRPYALLSV